jgi:hypothetical protein
VPTHGEAEQIIATWREIERALARAEPGSPEFERLTEDAALLRDEYQRLVTDSESPESPPLHQAADPA